MEEHFDEYEHYNFEHKHVHGKGGRGRSKKESTMHTNHHDISGHTRKTTQKLVNNHHKEMHKK